MSSFSAVMSSLISSTGLMCACVEISRVCTQLLYVAVLSRLWLAIFVLPGLQAAKYWGEPE